MQQSERQAGGATAVARLVAAVLAVPLALGLACSDGTPPTGVEGGLEPGDLYLLEGSGDWSTNSVSWPHRDPETGLVPKTSFGLVAAATRGSPATTHRFFRAPVNLACNDDSCWPASEPGWGEDDFFIEDLDWSPAGAQIVFQGRQRNSSTVRLYLRSSAGGDKREVRDGRMPSFTHDGARVVFVNAGKTGLGWFNSTGSGGGDWLQGYQAVEYPSMAPGDSVVAFSAQDGDRGRRIYVWRPEEPGDFPDVVSDPDPTHTQNYRDGRGDNYPVWSPGGRYLAYVSTLTAGTYRNAIFLTIPEQEPENIIQLISFAPGQQVGYLDWHPSGELMLLIVDNDVYMYVVPVRYRDPAP
jgi:hypothetical protein